MWFTGLYIYFAVPSYAMALGLFAGALTETLEKRKMEAMLSKRLTANEFRCAPKCRQVLLTATHTFSMVFARCANRKEQGNDSLDYSEFLEMELLRTGKVDSGFLDTVRSNFERYDISGDGQITIDEMIAGNVFSLFNDDGSAGLDFAEFSCAVRSLRPGGSLEQLQAEFDDARHGGDGGSADSADSVSLAQFLRWLHRSGIVSQQAQPGAARP